MKTLDINLGARSYQVCIGRGLLSRTEQIMPWIQGQQVCVVTDETVAPLYLDVLRQTLSGKQVIVEILPSGEANKNIGAMERIITRLLNVPCERTVTIVALGGGVVGDVAGFAASCYQRGVPFIQIPTTLLAQVDSSVGGKTAVNHALGKNMIGAFYQPLRVLADTATLDTLAERQFAAGMAEVIKYGVASDASFFGWLENNIESVMARDPAALEFIIDRSCRNKAQIIEQDELESGCRALLNLGHTFAHAIEVGTGYGEWLHGEAVATGLAMAAYMSQQMHWISAEERRRIDALLTAATLPVGAFVGLLPQKMLDLMKVDKKVLHSNLRLVLLKGIGKAEIVTDYAPPILWQTLQHFTQTES